jgi:hypothetical protein
VFVQALPFVLRRRRLLAQLMLLTLLFLRQDICSLGLQKSTKLTSQTAADACTSADHRGRGHPRLTRSHLGRLLLRASLRPSYLPRLEQASQTLLSPRQNNQYRC